VSVILLIALLQQQFFKVGDMSSNALWYVPFQVKFQNGNIRDLSLKKVKHAPFSMLNVVQVPSDRFPYNPTTDGYLLANIDGTGLELSNTTLIDVTLRSVSSEISRHTIRKNLGAASAKH
jgi:hypothetical protein